MMPGNLNARNKNNHTLIPHRHKASQNSKWGNPMPCKNASETKDEAGRV